MLLLPIAGLQPEKSKSLYLSALFLPPQFDEKQKISAESVEMGLIRQMKDSFTGSILELQSKLAKTEETEILGKKDWAKFAKTLKSLKTSSEHYNEIMKKLRYSI